VPRVVNTQSSAPQDEGPLQPDMSGASSSVDPSSPASFLVPAFPAQMSPRPPSLLNTGSDVICYILNFPTLYSLSPYFLLNSLLLYVSSVF